MPNNQPIKFLLHQLSNNEQDRERFEKLWEQKEMSLEVSDFENFLGKGKLANYEIIEFTRTCLSRVNNEAVLGVLKGVKTIDFGDSGKLKDFVGFPIVIEGQIEGVEAVIEVSNYLYKAFDFPICNGHPLSEAIEAMHNKMLELVPEYVEFLTNNK